MRYIILNSGNSVFTHKKIPILPWFYKDQSISHML